MSTYEQLDSFFKDLLEKEVEITSKWPEKEVQEIGEAVTAMVHHMVRSAIDSDSLFKQLLDLCQTEKSSQQTNTETESREGVFSGINIEKEVFEIVPVGSVEEGTKINKPDERDFLLLLRVFSGLGLSVTESVNEEKHPFYKYVYLPEQAEQKEELLKLLRRTPPVLAWQVEKGSHVMVSAGLSLYFQRLLKKMYDAFVSSGEVVLKTTGSLKVMASKGDISVEMGVQPSGLGSQSVVNRTGPAITLTFLWKSEYEKRHSIIGVDIVPNIVVPTPANGDMWQNECKGMFGVNRAQKEIHLIPLKPMSSLGLYGSKGSRANYKMHAQSFLPSYSDLEVQLMRALQPDSRLAYKVLKHYTQTHFRCSCCKPSAYSFGFIIQSYLLKTMIIRHGHESNSCQHSGISECVLYVINEFRAMAEAKRLSIKSLWNSDHNLFSSKPIAQMEQHKPSQWKRELESFERHLSYLLKRFDEINEDESYSFEKYRKFHLKISNRAKRAAKEPSPAT